MYLINRNNKKDVCLKKNYVCILMCINICYVYKVSV